LARVFSSSFAKIPISRRVSLKVALAFDNNKALRNNFYDFAKKFSKFINII
jgi:hypothetical protein